MIQPSPTSLLVAAPADTIRRQERILGPLNLALLAGVALVHLLFSPLLGSPPTIFFAVLLARFVVQVLELIWLEGVSTPGVSTPGVATPGVATPGVATPGAMLQLYAHVPIWLNLAIAFALSRLGGMVDSHYIVLMLMPVLAAAFRYRPMGIVLVVGAACSGTALQIWLYFRGRAGDPAEYFEAANVALIYATVALVAALIARELRRDRLEVEQHLRQLELTRDELVRKERLAAIGRLAGAVAHEIRNPVALISTSLALARRGDQAALPREELDRILAQEIARLEKLTSDFLAYARQRPPDRRPTALGPLLEVVASMARARAHELGVTVVRDPVARDSVARDAGNGPAVDANGEASFDPYLVQQALLNLVGNALDATPRGGRVELAGRVSPLTVEITVTNSGPAIPVAAVERIFEPFFSTKPDGNGLGLAISRGIAEAHGGELELATNRDGEVRFVLRLATSAGASEPQPEAARWPAS